ncbi:MAG: hypothetical protein H6Q77_2579 [Gemmatimonadetes bacterium]|nr:hypothetical protein [Gemmatimonadota bacterium]
MRPSSAATTSLPSSYSPPTAIVLLYFFGRALGRATGIPGRRTGLSMVAIGVVLVGIAITLGG